MELEFVNWVLISIRLFSFAMIFTILRTYVGILGLASSSLVFSTLFVSSNSRLVEISGVLFFSYVLREAIVGGLIALPLAIAMHAFRIAGRTTDVARGAQIGEQLNPAMGESLSSFESLFQLMTVVVILALGVHRAVFAMLQESFQKIPLCTIDCGVIAGFDWSILFKFAPLAAYSLKVGILLVAPILIAAFLIDISAAFVARAAPKINVSFEVLPLKTICGIFIVALSLGDLELPSEVLSSSMSVVFEIIDGFSAPEVPSAR